MNNYTNDPLKITYAKKQVLGQKKYGFEDFVDHKLDGLDGEVQRSEFWQNIRLKVFYFGSYLF